MSRIDVAVYKSRRRAETYVYLEKEAAFEDLPDAFRDQFGPEERFLEFELYADKQLAQVDAQVVLDAIATQGFYLQLPPQGQGSWVDGVILQQRDVD